MTENHVQDQQKSYVLHELTSKDLKELMGVNPVMIFQTGATEQQINQKCLKPMCRAANTEC